MRFSLFVLALTIGIATIVGVVSSFFSHHPPSSHHLTTYFIHVALISSIFVFVFANRKISNIFLAIGRLYQIISVLMFTVLLTGHLINKSTHTFPFVNWPMYALAPPEAKLDQLRSGVIQRGHYQAVYRNGQVADFELHKLTTTLQAGRIYHPLYRLLSQFLNAKNESQKQNTLEKVQNILVPVGRIYNRLNPDTPLQSIRLSRIHDPIKLINERGPVEIVPILTVDIPFEAGP